MTVAKLLKGLPVCRYFTNYTKFLCFCHVRKYCCHDFSVTNSSTHIQNYRRWFSPMTYNLCCVSWKIFLDSVVSVKRQIRTSSNFSFHSLSKQTKKWENIWKVTDQKRDVWYCNVVLARPVTLRFLRYKCKRILLLVGHCSIAVEHNIHLLRIFPATQTKIAFKVKSMFRNGQVAIRQNC